MPTSKINLNKILLDTEKLSPEELDKALALQKKSKKELRDILIEEGYITEDELLSLISYYLYIPFIDLAKFKIDPEVIRLIPEDVARNYNLFPLCKSYDSLLIAVAEPLDIITLDNLRLSIGCDIKQVLSKEKLILQWIDNYYSKIETLPQILDFEYEESLEVVKSRKAEEAVSLDLIQESQKQPIVQAVNLVINEAIQKRASDIHLEPTDEDLTVRYRIDGILHVIYNLPKKIQRGIAARIKILSGLDITKFYIPQDGRFHIATENRDIDFRVSTLPTIFGEKFVLRILDKTTTIVKLDELGFSEQPLSLLKEAVAKEHGMILITGPTGSGKSTTLYAILTELNTLERHIVTVEDPVEYQIDGVTQTQVKPEIELTFAAALRGLLRQSPDTVMIGEIRDTETADIAIKAALIGQLILSTLHTNDAVSAFARLIDMGVGVYLVAAALMLICAQRLCRRIRHRCKEPLKSAPKEMLKELGTEIDKDLQFYHGVGCPVCNHSGYFGRVALLEALKVDDPIKSMVIRQAPLEEIKEFALKEGRLITLRKDGLHKASKGVTTLEEIYRVTAMD